jgi:hypothetical protein
MLSGIVSGMFNDTQSYIHTDMVGNMTYGDVMNENIKYGVWELAYYMTILYIMKLLYLEGLPSLSIALRTIQFANNVPPNTLNREPKRMAYLGTRKRGVGIKYIAERDGNVSRITTTFFAKGDEGKMIMMILAFPFSFVCSIAIGIMIDAGTLKWKLKLEDINNFLITFLINMIDTYHH